MTHLTSQSDASASPPPEVGPASEQRPPVLLLGKGWFPDQLGGSNRYYRDLLESLPEAVGILIGPAAGAPARVHSVSSHSAALVRRLIAIDRAVKAAAPVDAVVDAHFALYAWFPVVFGAARDRRLIVHFHGPWAAEAASARGVGKLGYLARTLLERAVYRRAELCVTLTSAFRRELVESYGVSPWRIAVIPPGVDQDHFHPVNRDDARQHFAVRNETFVVCCVRRLVPRMGISTLLEAWSEAFDTGGSLLLIAGEGDERPHLEATIRRLGLDHTVRLLGRISDDELLSLYSAADLNVVPSRAIEGFGLTVLEAAACGTPSVVTAVGGLPEAVRGLSESDDLVVPPMSPSRLATRLQNAADGNLPSREFTQHWARKQTWRDVASRHREIFAAPRQPGLRVVYLDHTGALSGGELALVRLLESLDGVLPHVILGEDGPLVTRLMQRGISVEVLPLSRRTQSFRKGNVKLNMAALLSAVDTLAYSLRVAARLHSLKPDVVHTNSLKAGVYGSLAARLVHIPVVWHVRDRLAGDYLPHRAIRPLRIFIRGFSSGVIANSHTTLETVVTGNPSPRAVVIPSAVATSVRTQRITSDQPFTVGIVGRLAPWKGQHIFIRAFARAFADSGARAVVVGAALFGPEDKAYADSLHKLVEDLGLCGRVEFAGHREDMSAQLGRLDLLVHASTLPEPFGQVILEGMAAGVPVVATRAGGPSEIVRDGHDGILYTPGDVDQLASVLSQLANDPVRRAALRDAGLQRAQDFSPSQSARAVLALYRSVARSRD